MTTWTIPDPPPPAVTTLWDDDGAQWCRLDDDSGWVPRETLQDEPHITDAATDWRELLYEYGPLTDEDPADAPDPDDPHQQPDGHAAAVRTGCSATCATSADHDSCVDDDPEAVDVDVRDELYADDCLRTATEVRARSGAGSRCTLCGYPAAAHPGALASPAEPDVLARRWDRAMIDDLVTLLRRTPHAAAVHVEALLHDRDCLHYELDAAQHHQTVDQQKQAPEADSAGGPSSTDYGPPAEPLDLDAVERVWLVQCNPCDYGPDAGSVCRCAVGDHREVMADLVAEVRRLRAEQDDGKFAANHGKVSHAAEVRRVRDELGAELADAQAEAGRLHRRWYEEQQQTTAAVTWAGDLDPPEVSGGGEERNTDADVERYAARVHQAYLDTCARLGWQVKPANAVPYKHLPDDAQELDRATVRAVLDALTAAGWRSEEEQWERVFRETENINRAVMRGRAEAAEEIAQAIEAEADRYVNVLDVDALPSAAQVRERDAAIARQHAEEVHEHG